MTFCRPPHFTKGRVVLTPGQCGLGGGGRQDQDM